MIQTNAEHYQGLANYIKVKPEKSPLVAIDGGKRIKYVFEVPAAELTADKIVECAETWLNGTGHEYKIDEDVVYSDNDKVQEEL